MTNIEKRIAFGTAIRSQNKEKILAAKRENMPLTGGKAMKELRNRNVPQ